MTLLVATRRSLLNNGTRAPVVWLQFDFATAAAAPLSSPLVEIGSLTLTQTDGQFSKSGGNLVFPAQATPVFYDQNWIGASQSRLAGRTFFYRIAPATITSLARAYIGWGDSATPSTSLDGGQSFGWNISGSDNEISVYLADLNNLPAGQIHLLAEYDVAIILRATGALYVMRGGVYEDWTLIFVESAGTTTPQYPLFVNHTLSGNFAALRGVDLPAPFDSDYGIATSRLAGARSAGDTFAHTPDFLLHWTQTTRASASSTEMRFRIVDANNYMRVTIDSTGLLTLSKVVASVATSLGSVAAAVVTGERVSVIAFGSTIYVYDSTARRIAVTTATDFTTAASGKLEALGTSGVVSNIEVYPRDLVGSTKTVLDAILTDIYYNPFWKFETLARTTLWTGAGGTDWLGRAVLHDNSGTWITIYRQGSQHAYDSASVFHIRFSTNEGVTWTAVDTFTDASGVTGAPFVGHSTNAPSDAIIFEAPNGDLLIHVGEHNSSDVTKGTYQYRSTDQGDTWTDEGKINSDDDLFGGQDFVVVGSDIYITTVSSGWASPIGAKLYKSTNNGTTWTYVSEIMSTAENGNEAGIIYLGGTTLLTILRDTNNVKTYKRVSTDMGATWGSLIDVTSSLRVLQRARMRIFSDEPDRIYLFGRDVGTTYNYTVVYYSDDDGANWSERYYPDVTPHVDTGYCDMLKRTDDSFYMQSYAGASQLVASIVEYVFEAN